MTKNGFFANRHTFTLCTVNNLLALNTITKILNSGEQLARNPYNEQYTYIVKHVLSLKNFPYNIEAMQ